MLCIHHSEIVFTMSTSKVLEDVSTLSTKNEHLTTPYMTHLEYARVVGVRALQLSTNKSPQIPLDGDYDPIRIARRELEAGVVNLVIRRTLPDGRIDDWHVKDMVIVYHDAVSCDE